MMKKNTKRYFNLFSQFIQRLMSIQDDSKAGLKALYNEDEDSYSDDEDNPIEGKFILYYDSNRISRSEAPKGEKRKHLEENTDGPPRKL